METFLSDLEALSVAVGMLDDCELYEEGWERVDALTTYLEDRMKEVAVVARLVPYVEEEGI